MFAELAYFVGAYVHQDWVDDYGDLRAVIADFKSRESSELPARVITDIDAVLQRYTDEGTLRALLIDQMHSNYRAEVDGSTYRQWLIRVRDIMLEDGEQR